MALFMFCPEDVLIVATWSLGSLGAQRELHLAVDATLSKSRCVKLACWGPWEPKAAAITPHPQPNSFQGWVGAGSEARWGTGTGLWSAERGRVVPFSC